jgi:hypothetical protein
MLDKKLLLELMRYSVLKDLYNHLGIWMPCGRESKGKNSPGYYIHLDQRRLLLQEDCMLRSGWSKKIRKCLFYEDLSEILNEKSLKSICRL